MSARKPKLAVPVGATDTHMHIYHAEVPSAPGGPPLPGDYRVEQYREVQQRLGLSRVIVVQPNAYQDDNRVTLAAISALGTWRQGRRGRQARRVRCGHRLADRGRNHRATHLPTANGVRSDSIGCTM